MTASPHEAIPALSSELPAHVVERGLRSNLLHAATDAIPWEVDLAHAEWAARTIENIVGGQVTPENRRKTKVAGDYLMWKAFRDNAAPPNGVRPYHAHVNGRDVVSIDFDPASDVTRHDAMEMASILLLSPQGKATQELRGSAIQANEGVQQAARIYMEATPAYRFLASFAQTAEQPTERQLTNHERLTRETVIEHDVRRRHGLDPHVVMLKHSAAGREMGRRLRWLDDETMPQSVEGGRDSLDSFRQFAVDTYRKYVLEQTGEHLLDITYKYNMYGESFRLEFADGTDFDEVRWLSYGAGNILAEKILDVIDVQPEFAHDVVTFVQKEMMLEALNIAFSRNIRLPHANGGLQVVPATYEALLQRALNKGVTSLVDQVAVSFQFAEDNGALGDGGDTAAWLRGIGIEDAEPGPDWGDFRERLRGPLDYRPVRSQAAIASREQYAEEQQRTYGWIARSGAARQDNIARILTSQYSSQELPRTAAHSDLALALENPHHHSILLQPFISGYDLVAFNPDNGVYHFVRNQDEDDYTRPPLKPFNMYTVRTLRHEYERLGLDALAAELTAREETLDAYQLERLIAGLSDYTYDEAMQVQPEITALSDFKGQIKGGRLQTQCTGAAQFLMESLRILTGYKAAGLVAGYVLPIGKDARVSAQGHAQVRAFIDGKAVMLDATPEASSAGVARGMRQSASTERVITRRAIRHGQKLAERALKAAAKQKPDDMPQNSLEKTPAIQQDEAAIVELRAELAEKRRPELPTIRGRFEDVARIALDVRSREQLYKKVLTLQEGDPLRATLRLVLQDTITDEMIAARLASLTTYSQAKPEAVKRAGLKQYDPKLLEELILLTQELARARR